MGKKIRILVSDLKVEAELNDSKTAQLILETLPIGAKDQPLGRGDLFRHSGKDWTRTRFKRSGLSRRIRILAYRPCFLHLLRPHPGEPRR